VIDFDKAMRNPADTASLVSSYQNDGLHPDAEGYKRMGDSIDLSLFEDLDSRFPIKDNYKFRSSD
jgi:lysophospholipase L1-like esterase